MFKHSLSPTSHKPLFANEVHPEGKVQKKANVLPKSLNSYEIIRDKVVHEMQTKMPKVEPKVDAKEKLINF